MGENCGYFNSSSASTKSDTTWAVNVCNMWYNETEKYDFNINEYQQQTGHFTQVLLHSDYICVTLTFVVDIDAQSVKNIQVSHSDALEEI